MKTSYNYIFALALCLTGVAAQCQNNYLLNFEHKENGNSQNVNFYLEELPPGANPARPDVVALRNALYKVHFLRLSEPSASSYFGCTKYSSQAAGEQLSVNNLLSDSVLRSYDQKQRAIEDNCAALLNNKGRQNSLLTLKLNDRDRLKMVPVTFDICNCKVSREQFSPMYDTLAMVRKIDRTALFSDAEKAFWKNNAESILDNDFVKSCLARPDVFAEVYHARRD